jgi:hypothetical protein
MKSVYVVLGWSFSPIAITHPWPVAAFATRKEATAFADQIFPDMDEGCRERGCIAVDDFKDKEK